MRGAIVMLLGLLLAAPSAVGADGPGRKRRRSSRGTHAQSFAGLVHKLVSGPGLQVRNEVRAWGTEKAVRVFEQAVEVVRTLFPNTPDLFIGDLSWHRGGKMRPHVSHRDGRDIDVGYYFADGAARTRFYRVGPKELDAARTWALFESMIETGEVEYIFLRHRLQKPLFEEALRRGYSRAALEGIFQYPRTAWNRQGIIRHARGHDTHFHVRFTEGPLPAAVRGTSDPSDRD